MLSELLDPNRPIALFARAVGFAESAHGDQLDKGGELYVYHCFRVGASLLPDINAAVAGVLHDVLEDTVIPPGALCEFIVDLLPSTGIYVFATVQQLTRDPAVDYADYIAGVADHFLARRVKLADLKDNLRPERMALAVKKGWAPEEAERRRQRYIDARNLLLNAEAARVL